jgi:hypothetical protein
MPSHRVSIYAVLTHEVTRGALNCQARKRDGLPLGQRYGAGRKVTTKHNSLTGALFTVELSCKREVTFLNALS